MSGWVRDPATKAFVEADALALIRAHGEAAYPVARRKATDARRSVVDGNRKAGHWPAFAARSPAARVATGMINSR